MGGTQPRKEDPAGSVEYGPRAEYPPFGRSNPQGVWNTLYFSLLSTVQRTWPSGLALRATQPSGGCVWLEGSIE